MLHQPLFRLQILLQLTLPLLPGPKQLAPGAHQSLSTTPEHPLRQKLLGSPISYPMGRIPESFAVSYRWACRATLYHQLRPGLSPDLPPVAAAGQESPASPRPVSLWLDRLMSELSVIWLLGLGVFLVVLSSAVLAANPVGQI